MPRWCYREVPSGRTFETADLDDAEALASRTAVALDNAKLYQDVQHADRQKNEFLSMLAHELRNPLAPIRNAVEVLRRQGSNRSGLAWAHDVIDRQVGHMVRLVDDLLDLSRITRGKIRLRPEPIEIADIVSHAVEASRPVIEARRHRLDVSLPTESLWVSGDAARLSQVLTNLLNNAAKYTPEGGYIWLSGLREDNEIVMQRARYRGRHPRRNAGYGLRSVHAGGSVPGALRRRTRNRFDARPAARGDARRQRRAPLAKASAAAANSRCASKLIKVEETETPVTTVDRFSVASYQNRILVVDDNVDGADSLAVLLRLSGHEVSLAHDGLAALDVARAFRPEIVLLDIGLPGMDGYEVARRLRGNELTRDVILVAVTGYGRDEDRARSHEAGFDYHLVKPISFDAMHGVFQHAATKKCKTSSFANASALPSV